MQEAVGVNCRCVSGDDEHDHTATCDRCGDTVPEARTRTVTVSVDEETTNQFQFCPACFVNWRERFYRELVPESNGDDSDIIVA